ncbi:MAG: addiction module protein [Kiritimatiellae bacterium]|jgi:hypothetical protein|nr:addiction module protein [Kiritimatiellia bacterium]
MTITEQVLQLPRKEKLKIMETLWIDLSPAKGFETPEWHGQVLKETQAKFDSGEIKALDWEEAKRRLKDEKN